MMAYLLANCVAKIQCDDGEAPYVRRVDLLKQLAGKMPELAQPAQADRFFGQAEEELSALLFQSSLGLNEVSEAYFNYTVDRRLWEKYFPGSDWPCALPTPPPISGKPPSPEYNAYCEERARSPEEESGPPALKPETPKASEAGDDTETWNAWIPPPETLQALWDSALPGTACYRGCGPWAVPLTGDERRKFATREMVDLCEKMLPTEVALHALPRDSREEGLGWMLLVTPRRESVSSPYRQKHLALLLGTFTAVAEFRRRLDSGDTVSIRDHLLDASMREVKEEQRKARSHLAAHSAGRPMDKADREILEARVAALVKQAPDLPDAVAMISDYSRHNPDKLKMGEKAISVEALTAWKAHETGGKAKAIEGLIARMKLC